MDVRYLVLLLFFISCMPEQTVSRGNLAGSESTSGSGSGSGTGTTSPIKVFNWSYLGKASRSITINTSNLNTAYIIGSPVETYLSDTENNFSNVNYCLVSSFSIAGKTIELRSRVTPISYYDFTTQKYIRNFRVDFPDVTSSQSKCGGTLYVKNSSGLSVVDSPAPYSVKFNPKEICPLCTSMITASRIRLFKLQGPTDLFQVPDGTITTSVLSLQVNPNNDSTGGSGSCSNSECVDRGFNCCLENQCVINGAVKPAAASTYPSQLATAEEEKKSNPLAYLNYPHLYYVCGSSVPETTGGTSGGGTTTSGSGSGGGGYDEAFAQLKKDYYCVENIKAQATMSPFHSELLSRTYTPSVNCLTGASEENETQHYQNVMKRLYTTCGCNRTDLQDMITNCPAYEYTVVLKDNNNEPTRIDCYTPPATTPAPALQTVSVSSRSAPHRFFDENGIEKDPAKATVQEGDKFEYLDDGKVVPSQKSYSMNAILGQMSVTLDQALPAKSVQVELDQVYFISTISGTYTPCPTCAKDSWLGSFSAYPSTSMGTGLQAVGHNTERDSFGTNNTLGNYEDTIFGRACWLPPTMIPFSQPSTTVLDAKSQRIERLKAQSAFFVNGYQRDWYGFNKGALIGSFDGVSWFAVGKGRIVRSTTKKLFLAINAPFADLANASMHVVRVQAYDGVTQAAQVDYDPQYHQTHPYQNEAGNCQKYHMCNTDTDCVTKLGWEYACADVKDIKTNWPQFDANGNEIANGTVNLTIDKILHQKKFPSSSTKRCVYRGAGSLCHSNVGSLAGTELNKKKLLTCAPNFYCANPAVVSTFNDKVARFGSLLEDIPLSRNHIFGKDANILGRPLDYLGTSALPVQIRQIITSNAQTFEPTLSTYAGLCQPGKALPTTANYLTMQNPFTQHASADSQRRADYISQIGSCNSTLFSSYRHTSCPVIGSDGNYEMFSSASFPTANFNKRATEQNSCGLESLHTSALLTSSAETLSSSSPFRSIEGKPLNSQIILDQTLARDACFRRAGAVCHTDLDCSPNKLHASKVELFGKAFFGNNAEKTFWSEPLVCGQTDPKPFPTQTEAYKNYDMSLNRCCREVGKDLTTFTADVPLSTDEASSYDEISKDLNMSEAPGMNPNSATRYSRLATVEGIGSDPMKPVLTANIDRNGSTLQSKNNVATAYQWNSLGEANSETCCGGGWIRKFADGSTDWTRRNRVSLDVTNFRCINSRTPLLTSPEDFASHYNNASDVQLLVSQDYGDYCKDATNLKGACAQYSIVDSLLDVLPYGSVPYLDSDGITRSLIPFGNASRTIINTIKPNYAMGTNPDYYFTPRSGDENASVIVDYADSSSSARRNISLRIPSYVPRTFDNNIATQSISMVLDNGSGVACTHVPAFNPASSTTVPDPAVCATGCCYSLNASTRILKVGMNPTTAAGPAFANKKLGVEITVNNVPGNSPVIPRTQPGTSAYYLKRLGRLELSGIPQINYEILTCNDNADRIVPGIFDPEIKTKLEFAANSFSYLLNYRARTLNGGTVSTDQRFTNMHGLQNEPVFSSSEFKCCSPLGKTVSDQSRCCSGYATTSGTIKTCALPSGTDLMVYFNRFVSNEGVGTDKPGGGLTTSDFDAQTGEPVLSSIVNDKIRALGAAYCASGKVRQGGAFGSFEVEPQGSDTNLTSRIYNIVDSTRDVGQNSNAGATDVTGYPAFSSGFRWNHHLYCND